LTDLPLGISLINSLLTRVTTNEEKAELLIRKLSFLQRMKGCDSYVEGLVAEIYKADPSNLEYKLKHIKNLFNNQDIWEALTEYMRFEADALYQLKQA
jgi:hypothetical protein